MINLFTQIDIQVIRLINFKGAVAAAEILEKMNSDINENPN